MEHPVKAPAVGESITEVRILKWLKSNGQAVKAGDVLVEIETDKATVEVSAEKSGALKILKDNGTTVNIGTQIASIDDQAKGVEGPSGPSKAASPAPSSTGSTPVPPPVSAAFASKPLSVNAGASNQGTGRMIQLSPSVRRMAAEGHIDVAQVQGSGPGGRIRKEDLFRSISNGKTAQSNPEPATPKAAIEKMPDRPGDRRTEMSRIRAKIAERLVYAQHTAAILTTFNEIDMSAVNEVRKKHKDAFKTKTGFSLSYMSFFTRAVVESLKLFPDVNASIDGKDIVHHDYFDIGIAVGTDRGLVVPVVRNAEKMNFLDIEKAIAALAEKARTGKLSIPEMTGGTFTISNGGTYGSLLSTPILNPPQSGILGMHKIQDRPVAIAGKCEIRPMMYVALSYDHRMIDGKGAVSFLVALKDFMEHPEKLKMEFV
jgi:2-oxoglutarate dehydrogenase E2 component (dihydrolipoamide succinyltransferase)